MHSLSPSTVDEVRAAVADTAGTHPRLLITGAGTAAGWGAPAAPADAIVDTTALSGVVKYAPADLTIAVLAGTPFTAIQQTLAEAGQRVAFDPARARHGATVGGLLATADAGPLRTAFGSLRDLVIGTTVVLGDATVASSGGHVIKNVAGYDLAKLFHGSLGTLGVVAEVVLRLHPLPQATSTVAVDAGVAEAFELAGKIVMTGWEASALEWCDGRLLVKLEGTEAGVRQREAEVCRLAGASARALSDEEAATAWESVAAVADGGPNATVVRIGTLPAAGPAVVEKLASATSSVAIGVHTARFEGGDHDELLARLHTEFGAAVTVLHREGLSDRSGWGPPPAPVGVLRAVKRQFDPAGRFGAGRFTPWLENEERAS
ncbi:FAD-binding protein [Amycolatopsis rhabdoformis]|uniref:FAD-binding protein n=1 Tax=Amycolatopsis rhabdoformis TaxID=1448059 RepID=A0ABZ1HWM4_9PSEU|nr:FAD-binding protein [Amycolatopsis rhabdoformis]WSE26259.1 FAD-binding protein [Amycolatopsis rhabdoformis]